MIEILAAGPDTTLQGLPRRGWRHYGVPAGGAADGLSAALALRLVGQPASAPVIEFTLAGGQVRFHEAVAFAITGAPAVCQLNGVGVALHQTLRAEVGDLLQIGPPALGLRTYLALAGALCSETVFDSPSTYVPARLGGYQGRALQVGDRIALDPVGLPEFCETPTPFIPPILESWYLRAVVGPEFSLLSSAGGAAFFEETFMIGRRLSRMGGALEGHAFEVHQADRVASGAVFPGTVQCPPSGAPFLLMADAQTTGGYPRLAQVIAADRHMLGQLRPGARVRFIKTDTDEAADVLRRKTRLLRGWLGEDFLLSR